jgi:hypothetical protein
MTVQLKRTKELVAAVILRDRYGRGPFNGGTLNAGPGFPQHLECPMSNSLSIFNGALLRDLDPDEVSNLDEADQEFLAETIIECRAAEAQDTLVAEKRKVLYAKMAALNAAVEADQLANPPTSPTEAARAAIHANNPHLAKIEPRKPNKKARAALAEANRDLAETQSD